MRRWRNKAAMIFCVMFFSANCWAMDYSVFSNQELFELKGAVGNAELTEQEAYQKEWRKRLENMSEEERKKFSGTDENESGHKDGKEPPVVIQGKGYDKNEGTVIYGGRALEGGRK